jgi:hypothetical protein
MWLTKVGKYGKIFKIVFNAGADALKQLGLISSKKGLGSPSFDVVNDIKYLTLEDVDAMLISGSRESISQLNA